MSAARLREAAALMRERAEAATDGPWEVGDYWHIQGAAHCRCDAGPLVWSGRRDINGTRMAAHVHRRAEPISADIMQADASDGYPANVSYASDYGPGVDPVDAAHIASWHPAVALAVADWLEGAARDFAYAAHLRPDRAAALAVANAYLGSAS